jgi:hypothetical protein
LNAVRRVQNLNAVSNEMQHPVKPLRDVVAESQRLER